MKYNYSDAVFCRRAGAYGTASVDLFSGAPAFSAVLASTNYKTPGVVLAYNFVGECCEKLNYSADSSRGFFTAFSFGSYAKGWKLNIQQSLRVIDKNSLLLVDAAGHMSPFSRIYVKKRYTDKFYPDSGYGHTFVKSPFDETGIYEEMSGSAVARYILFDGKGSEFFFEKASTDDEFVLTCIKTAENKRIFIDYDTAANHIVSIRTSSAPGGLAYTFNYTKNVLDSISDHIANRTVYFTYSGGTLSEIAYGGDSLRFTYDSSLMKSAVTSAAYKLDYTYDSSGRVVCVTESAGYTKIAHGQTVPLLPGDLTNVSRTEFCYADADGYYATYVKTHSGIKTTYEFRQGCGLTFFNCATYEGEPFIPAACSLMKQTQFENNSDFSFSGRSIIVNGNLQTLEQGCNFAGFGMLNGSVHTETTPFGTLNTSAELSGDSSLMQTIPQEINGNIYKIRKGLYTFSLWVKTSAHSSNPFTAEAIVLAADHSECARVSVGNDDLSDTTEHWQIIRKTLLCDVEPDKIASIKILVNYNGEEPVYIDNLSLTLLDYNTASSVKNEQCLLYKDADSGEYKIGPIDLLAVLQDSDPVQTLFNAYYDEGILNAPYLYTLTNGDRAFLRDCELIPNGNVCRSDENGNSVTTLLDTDLNPAVQKIITGGKTPSAGTFDLHNAFDCYNRLRQSTDYRSLIQKTDYTDEQSDGSFIRTFTVSPDIPAAPAISASEEINSAGEVVKTYDEHNNATQYRYENDLITQIILPGGQQYNYTYNSDRMLTNITFKAPESDAQSIDYAYTLGYITQAVINNKDFFRFEYDGYGNNTKIIHNDKEIYSAEYFMTSDFDAAGERPYNYIKVTEYGRTFATRFDKYGSPTAVYEINGTDETLTAQYEYTPDTHEPIKAADYTGGAVMFTDSDSLSRSVTIQSPDSDYSHYMTFDGGRIVSERYRAGFVDRSVGYTYDKRADNDIYPDNRLTGVSLTGAQGFNLGKTSYLYDEYGRLSAYSLSDASSSSPPLFCCDYAYYTDTQKNKTSSRVDKITVHTRQCDENGSIILPLSSGSTDISYSYDKNNRITNVSCGGYSAQYTYDGCGRLIREDNSAFDATTLFTYDDCGNILCKTQCPYTADTADFTPVENTPLGTFLTGDAFCGETFCESDQTYTTVNGCLSLNYEYDDRGRLIKAGNIFIGNYDEHGCPRNYGRSVLSWNGQNLTSWDDFSFRYDADGRRIKKTSKDGYTLFFYDENGSLLQEKRYRQDILTDTVTYIYAAGDCIGFSLWEQDGSDIHGHYLEYPFYFVKDLSGNVTQILDKQGTCVIKYYYDAWGNMIHEENPAYCLTVKDKVFHACDIFQLNGFTYRGCYFDKDLGLYYLIHRYYDPETGRFISPVDIENLDPTTIGGLNLYTYTANNPIAIKYDSSVSNYGNGMVSSIDFGTSSTGATNIYNPTAPEWIKLLVGAIPDLKVSLDYLKAHGTKSSFAYATSKTYRFPILGGTHSAFTKGKYSYNDLVGASFRKITTDSARGGFGSFAKNFAKTSVYTLGINFAFNLYENNWQIDGAMIQDTLIDTAIGVGSYYMAAGTMSLLTAGALVAFGWNVPGLIVVGGVVVLSIAYDALIRWITGYDE